MTFACFDARRPPSYRCTPYIRSFLPDWGRLRLRCKARWRPLPPRVLRSERGRIRIDVTETQCNAGSGGGGFEAVARECCAADPSELGDDGLGKLGLFRLKMRLERHNIPYDGFAEDKAEMVYRLRHRMFPPRLFRRVALDPLAAAAAAGLPVKRSARGSLANGVAAQPPTAVIDLNHARSFAKWTVAVVEAIEHRLVAAAEARLRLFLDPLSDLVVSADDTILAPGGYGMVALANYSAAEVTPRCCVKWGASVSSYRILSVVAELDAIRESRRHPHLVQLVGLISRGVPAGGAEHGLVFEWPGYSLASEEVQRGADLAQLVAEASAGLAHLHGCGVSHGAIGVETVRVVVAPGGGADTATAKLTDYASVAAVASWLSTPGLSTPFDPSKSDRSVGAGSADGVTPGSSGPDGADPADTAAMNAAPEDAAAADVYALGAAMAWLRDQQLSPLFAVGADLVSEPSLGADIKATTDGRSHSLGGTGADGADSAVDEGAGSPPSEFEQSTASHTESTLTPELERWNWLVVSSLKCILHLQSCKWKRFRSDSYLV